VSRTYHHGKFSSDKKRQVARYRKLGRALLELTEAQLEKEAETSRGKRQKQKSKRHRQ
jgi:hypothetical protein